MPSKRIMVVGGGIAGLTSAIALRRAGFTVDVLEIDPKWSVSGVGIIQQANVVRAMAQLGLVDAYLAASFGFDTVLMHDTSGRRVAEIPTSRLAGHDFPANLGVSRPALHKMLGDTARELGARIHLGVTVDSLTDTLGGLIVRTSEREVVLCDLLIGADGLYSKVRELAFPEAPRPQRTGQAVWRYNLPRLPEVTELQVYTGAAGNAGLVPMSPTEMYVYVTSEDRKDRRSRASELAKLMRDQLSPFEGVLAQVREQIVDSTQVVYRPIESVFVAEPWYRGRIVLIGDAAHATSPHLGQGAGMAIEDSVVLGEELAANSSLSAALANFMRRRYERCRFIVESSLEVSRWEQMRRQDVDRPAMVRRMFEVTSQPI